MCLKDGYLASASPPRTSNVPGLKSPSELCQSERGKGASSTASFHSFLTNEKGQNGKMPNEKRKDCRLRKKRNKGTERNEERGAREGRINGAYRPLRDCRLGTGVAGSCPEVLLRVTIESPFRLGLPLGLEKAPRGSSTVFPCPLSEHSSKISTGIARSGGHRSW